MKRSHCNKIPARPIGLPVMAELLEQRRLFSVSAVTLAGPLTIGSNWQYTDGSSVAVAGTDESSYVSQNNLSVITTYPNSYLSPTFTTFEALDGRRGLIAYENDYLDPTTPYAVANVNTPAAVLFPHTMVAGHTYKSRFTSTAYSTDSGGTTVQTDTVMLVSDSLQSITVPAGIFSAYEIVESGGITQWIAPGVGVVETDSTSDGSTSVAQLTSYSIAGDPTQPQLVANVLSTSLASNVVSGSASNAVVRVALTNLGSVISHGPTTTDIYGSTDGSIDSSSVLLASVLRKLSLNLNGTIDLNLRIKSIPANLNASYELFARATNSAGESVDLSSDISVAIGPPVVDLSEVELSAVVSRHGTGPAVVTLEISNSGNTRTDELANVQFFATDSQAYPIDLTGATLVSTQHFQIKLAPGSSHQFSFKLTPAMVEIVSLDAWLATMLIAAGSDDVPIEINSLSKNT